MSALRPLKIVVNAGNGGAGAVIDLLAPHLPFEFICIHHEPDGTFPHGIPNPLLPENREATAEAVIDAGADFGIAWDGDFDRCFLFDAAGGSSRATTSWACWRRNCWTSIPARKIIHDPRLTWNTVDMVQAGGRHADSEQDRPRLHQGAHARRGRGLRWRNERPPLLPRFRLLRLAA